MSIPPGERPWGVYIDTGSVYIDTLLKSLLFVFCGFWFGFLLKFSISLRFSCLLELHYN